MTKGRRSRYFTQIYQSPSDLNSPIIQVTRRIKRTLQKSVVGHAVAERQKWAKFGKEKGNKPGPDRATTTVGEAVSLKLSAGNKVRLRQLLVLSGGLS